MFTNSSELLFLVPIAVTLLVLMARFDVYLSSRRNRMADARYLAEMRDWSATVPVDFRASRSLQARAVALQSRATLGWN
jgi:hypothetical protein